MSNDETMTFATFQPIVLQKIVDMWQLTGKVVKQEIETDTCGCKDEIFTLELSRPGVEPLEFSVAYIPGRVQPEDLTPVDMLRDLSAYFAGWFPDTPQAKLNLMERFVEYGGNGISAVLLGGVLLTEQLFENHFIEYDENTGSSVMLCGPNGEIL